MSGSIGIDGERRVVVVIVRTELGAFHLFQSLLLTKQSTLYAPVERTR